jgi:hypothetical protein
MGSDNDHITFLYHDVFEIHLGKFGGKNAASMQDKIIEHEEGYVGAFPLILEPGGTQSLAFNELDSGLFWMTEVEKEESRHEKRCGTATDINLKTPELILTLNDNGISNTEGKQQGN